MPLVAPLASRRDWLVPAVGEWKLIIRSHAHAEAIQLQNDWKQWGTEVDVGLKSEGGWVDTALLLRRHYALAKEVSDLQTATRLNAGQDVWIMAGLTLLVTVAMIADFIEKPYSLIGAIIGAAALLEIGYRFRRRGDLAETVVVLLSSAITATSAATLVDTITSTVIRQFLSGLELGALIWGFLVFLPRLMLTKMSAFEIRAMEKKRPVAALLLELRFIITWLSGPIDEFIDSDRRRMVASAFVRCSRIAEVGLLRSLDPPSTALRIQVAARLKQTALTLHGYGVWVLLPNQATRDELRRRCFMILAAMELQEFDLLPVDVPDGVTVVTKAKLVVEYTKRLAVALLLPLIVIVANRLNLLKDQAVFSYAVVASLFWVAINLGYLLDAQFSGKITALKDMTTTLNPSSSTTTKK